jgi:hypothetical protein
MPDDFTRQGENAATQWPGLMLCGILFSNFCTKFRFCTYVKVYIFAKALLITVLNKLSLNQYSVIEIFRGFGMEQHGWCTI